MLTKICGIGAGYVGGSTLIVLAKYCPEIQVTIVDISQEVIDQWNSDTLPIYEPGLDKIVKEVRGKNLFFSTDMEKAIDEAELIFISVDTPTKKYGHGQGRAPNLTNLEAAARYVAKISRSPKVVVEKSTVPIKAAETVTRILRMPASKQSTEEKNGINNDHSAMLEGSNRKQSTEFRGQCLSGLNRIFVVSSLSSDLDILDRTQKCNKLRESVVLSNPEFLAEGTAVHNLTYPDRVLIGGDEQSVSGRLGIEMLRSIYLHWVPPERIMVMSTWSSELSKLAANAFLAQRISSINAISAICEKTGADVRDVSRAVGADTRIGPHFLQASLGFGGSCFRKDLLNLVYISESLNLSEVASYWYSVLQLNEYQQTRFARRIVSKFNNTLQDKRIAVFGFAFKANTHDTRDSQTIPLCNALLDEKACVAIYDPKVHPAQIVSDLLVANSVETVQKHVVVCSSAEEAVTDAYAIVICTEWPEFKILDYKHLFSLMNRPAVIFDGRVLLNHGQLQKIGFEVESIGVDTTVRKQRVVS